MSITWKRKRENKVLKEQQKLFQENVAEDEDELLNSDEIDWLHPSKRRCLVLEDSNTKSERLKNEGCLLAEQGRYWEATHRFHEAINLTPQSEVLHELAAQAFMQLNEVFPALSMAEKAVKLKNNWWVSYQTLGRAQLGIGEVKMALTNFKKAIHLNPSERELWEEDLHWAANLLEKKTGNGSDTVEEELKEMNMTVSGSPGCPLVAIGDSKSIEQFPLKKQSLKDRVVMRN